MRSQEFQKCSRPDTPSLDNEVKKVMVRTLGFELLNYVSELQIMVKSTPPQPDSTDASADSRGPSVDEDLYIEYDLLLKEIVL